MCPQASLQPFQSADKTAANSSVPPPAARAGFTGGVSSLRPVHVPCHLKRPRHMPKVSQPTLAMLTLLTERFLVRILSAEPNYFSPNANALLVDTIGPSAPAVAP